MSFSFLGFLWITVLDSHFIIVENQITLNSLFFNPADDLFNFFIFDSVKIIVISAFETFGGPVNFFAVRNFLKCFQGNLVVLRELLKQLEVFLQSVATFL